MKNRTVKGYLINAAVIAVLLIAFSFVKDAAGCDKSFKLVFAPGLWQCCYLIIFAASLNLVLGFLGQLSLGHCGFMAIGAYAAALISLAFQRGGFYTDKSGAAFILVLFLCILIAGILAALMGLLVGLIGPNGAGKTTVFNMLTGVYKPTKGRILLNGSIINGKKPYEVVTSGIARTFQNIRLFKEMTVIENVKAAVTKDIQYGFGDAIFRTPKFWKSERDLTDKAYKLLSIFKLEDKADQLASNLPYGQQRKLEIARALATNAKMLLLDEPAAGMNPTETAELLACINLIRREFTITILLIEHNMSLVMNIRERIVVIDYGEIIAQGLPHDPKVIAAFLGE